MTIQKSKPSILNFEGIPEIKVTIFENVCKILEKQMQIGQKENLTNRKICSHQWPDSEIGNKFPQCMHVRSLNFEGYMVP